MNLLRRLWNRRPWGYPKPQEGEMLVGREILPTALGKVVVEARRVRPMALTPTPYGIMVTSRTAKKITPETIAKLGMPPTEEDITEILSWGSGSGDSGNNPGQ